MKQRFVSEHLDWPPRMHDSNNLLKQLMDLSSLISEKVALNSIAVEHRTNQGISKAACAVADGRQSVIDFRFYVMRCNVWTRGTEDRAAFSMRCAGRQRSKKFRNSSN